MLTAGAVLSSVKLSVAVVVSPAESVSAAVNVCAPSARPAGVKLQIPVLSAVVRAEREAALLDGHHRVCLTGALAPPGST